MSWGAGGDIRGKRCTRQEVRRDVTDTQVSTKASTGAPSHENCLWFKVEPQFHKGRRLSGA